MSNLFDFNCHNSISLLNNTVFSQLFIVLLFVFNNKPSIKRTDVDNYEGNLKTEQQKKKTNKDIFEWVKIGYLIIYCKSGGECQKVD